MNTGQTDGRKAAKIQYTYLNAEQEPRTRTGYYFEAGGEGRDPIGLMIYKLNNRWRVDHHRTGLFVKPLTPKGATTLKGTKKHIHIMFDGWPKLHAEIEEAASGIATVNPPVEIAPP